MSLRKAKRQPKALTVTEANAAVCKAHFCLTVPQLGWEEIPIAGTPAPKPCVYCGEVANISLRKEGADSRPRWFAFGECIGCGSRGPEAEGACEGDDQSIHGLSVEAARLWNCRKGGAE
jgi:hypothetical protein